MNKITVIGSGNVGSTIAYTLTVMGLASEIVMIDVNHEKSLGEALDIRQGVPFCNPASIYAGTYDDAKDSDIVVITSGMARKAGQSRLDLAQTNVDIIKQIADKIVPVAPNATYVIVSNPVDIMTYVFNKISGLPERQIIGSGTLLDTARLRYALSEHYDIAQRNIHAYVLGEHGDTSFVPWSIAQISGASIDDYQQGVIKKHENTRADKEADRIRHVDVCGAQTGPIFLAYRKDDILQQLVRQEMESTPIYDFTTEDGIVHRVWGIFEDETILAIQGRFAQINALYIADGHHRCASAVKAGVKRRESNPGHNGTEEYNYFLSVLFPADELYIMDYNRVVRDLNGYTPEDFLKRIAVDFDVTFVGQEKYRPSQKGEFGMYLGNSWYKLTAKSHILSYDAVDGLDVSVLQNALLAPVLNIQNPKTDSRIAFVGGIRGLEELERRVKQDMKVAFAMYPTSIFELFAVADAGRLMPPKSTWFEPKLRSGLFVHEI